MTAPISLRQQIEELVVLGQEHAEICKVAIYRGRRSEREIAFRRARFDAAITTLRWLDRNERLIKQRLGDAAC